MNRNARRKAHDLKRLGEDVGLSGRIASGNSLAAQNDEPEPVLYQQGGASQDERNLAAAWTGLSEQDLQLGDVQRGGANKGARWHQDNDRRARELDHNMSDVGVLR